MSDPLFSIFGSNLNSLIIEYSDGGNSMSKLELNYNEQLTKGSCPTNRPQKFNLDILERNNVLNSLPQNKESVYLYNLKDVNEEEEKNKNGKIPSDLDKLHRNEENEEIQIKEPISPKESIISESNNPSNCSMLSEILSTGKSEISLINTQRITDESSYYNSKQTINRDRKLTTCKCYRSNCRKKYCKCFSEGIKCVNCQCKNCSNNDLYIRRKICPEKYPESIYGIENKSKIHKGKKGCLCNKSKCNKQYCFCYKYGNFCHENCFCLFCKNKPSKK